MDTFKIIQNYVGRPWGAGAKGPESFSCWGLVQDIFSKYRGIELPDFAPESYDVNSLTSVFSDEQESKLNWRPSVKPSDFDVLLLGRSRFPCHCGILIRGMVLHSLQPTGKTGGGVVCQEPKRLLLQGWGYQQFLTHNSFVERARV